MQPRPLQARVASAPRGRSYRERSPGGPRRCPDGTPGWQLERDASESLESLADGRRQRAHGCIRGSEGLTKHRPRLLFHRAPMAGSPEPQAFLRLVVEVTDGDARHAINDCTAIDASPVAPDPG